MAAPNAYTQGIDEVIAVENEGTFGEIPTAVPVDGSAAVDHLPGGFSALISPLGNFVRADRKATRSALEWVLGKRAGTWSLRKYVLPSGSTAAPDDDLLWEAGLGTKSSRLYTLKKQITQSLRLWQFAGNFSRCVIGAIVDRILVEAPDSEPPVVSFSGLCKDVIYTGSGTVTSGTIGASTLTLGTGHGRRLSVGSLIRVDDGAPTSADDYRVTAIAGDVVTVTPVLTQTYSADVFYPQQQLTKTVAGSPIPATENAFTHEAVSTDWELIAATWELLNNFVLRDRQRGQATPTGFASNVERTLRASLTLYSKTPQTELFQAALQAVQRDLVITLGATTNKKCVLTGTNWVAEPINEEVGDGDVTLTVAGRCTGSSAGENEGQVEFTT